MAQNKCYLSALLMAVMKLPVIEKENFMFIDLHHLDS